MSNILSQRNEFIFLYDIKDASPNGDPLDSNKPRIDEETGRNIVTDTRCKRTIRDYLYTYEGYNGQQEKDIFVRELGSEKGGIKDGKARGKDFGEDGKSVLKRCIDARMFGCVIPLDKSSITYTGPIQLQMGRSLHRVEIKHIRGTGAFASSEGKQNKTFRDDYILPYSCIAFHGIANEQAAQSTELTEEDMGLFKKALWEGTKNLITRSKFGQLPRLLINIIYTQPGFFIGDLQEQISLISEKSDEAIRDITDFELDLTQLQKVLEINKDKIERVEYISDTRLRTVASGQTVEIGELLLGKMYPLIF